MSDSEEFDRIPWDHLSESKRSWSMSPRALVAAAAGMAVIALLTATLVSRSDRSAPTTSSTPEPTIASTTGHETTTTSVQLFAFSGPNLEAQAAGWAEWLTATYLTIDGNESSSWTGLLPEGSAAPIPAAGQRSFVDSVHALLIEQVADGRYRVLVRARTLVAIGVEPYRRHPDQVLAWTLRWQPEGWQLLDLPELVESPALITGPSQPRDQLPPHIHTSAAAFGVVIGASRFDDRWRVVVGMVDAVGGQWPYVLWFADDGTRLTTSG